jgi:hypothetical protein
MPVHTSLDHLPSTLGGLASSHIKCRVEALRAGFGVVCHMKCRIEALRAGFGVVCRGCGFAGLGSLGCIGVGTKGERG